MTAQRVDIGCGHWIEFAEFKGELAGVNVGHTHADGAECIGWCPFRGSKWSKPFEDATAHLAADKRFQCWDVVKADPLTLSPSIRRRVCGDHGHIQNGKWKPA